MSWGIAETASEIEKIKSKSADYLNGLNSCGVIDWDTYNYAFDFYMDLLMDAYRQGQKDTQPERKKGHWIKQNPMVDTEECSECGYNILGEEFETPFCPWCGARTMRYESVRCENCEHSSEAPFPRKDLLCKAYGVYCTSDGFCANWERKRE